VKDEIKLKYIMLRLTHPEFFSGEIFQDEDLLWAIHGNYAEDASQNRTLDRIWLIKGEDFNAFIYDDGNGWSNLVKLTAKNGKVLWNWTRLLG